MTRQKLRREEEKEKLVKFDVNSSNAHRILGKLAEKLECSELGVIYNGNDNPVLKAAVMSGNPVAASSGFESILLASIKKRGTFVAGEREKHRSVEAQ